MGDLVSQWRIAVVGALVGLPFTVLAVIGFWHLWTLGTVYTIAFGWGMAALMTLGYVLAWRWQKSQKLLRPISFEVAPYWTDRDREAWKLVEARAEGLKKVDKDAFNDINFYFETAKALADEVARFYNPRAKDPYGSLTVPECLAVVELASHDLAELVDKYLPGGHLMTIDNWRRAKQATEWYETASNVYWVLSALFNPVNTGLRYAASRVGMAMPLQLLQQNLVVWFATAYVQRMGNYLIELHSGRLRVGATRYRELMRAQATQEVTAGGGAPAGEAIPPEPVAAAKQVTLTVMGQVKMGKSSFINALLGEQLAQTSVLPMTAEVTRYELKPGQVESQLTLLDTVGYGHAGPKADQLKATREAALQSDLLVLVLHAKNPGRQADLVMLKGLKEWFDANPNRKMPPIVGVLTHIDLLSPQMEWAPPYNWQQPQRPKEQQIHQAVAAVREQLGEYLVGVAPVCVAPGKVYGVQEFFLPALAELLDEARAVALLRCLHNEADAGKVQKVFQQMLAVGQQAARILWPTLLGRPFGQPK